MNDAIVPLAEAHFEPLRRVLDAVAREKRFLALTQAPPPEPAHAFFRHILDNDLCHFVALLGQDVVGWCDILPTHGEARSHLGVLGIGLVPQARGRGLGARLMRAAIAKAWSQGLTRIELTVRTDNHNARSLYERLGFEHEGVNRRAFRIDGQYFDCHAMALLWADSA